MDEQQSTARGEVDLNISGVDDDVIPGDVLSAYSRFNPNRPRFYAERRRNAETVFRTDLPDFSASGPPATHWSVAWSDLMMTMFVLFFTLYIAGIENQLLIREITPESIAGTTSAEAAAKTPPAVSPQLTRILRTAPSTLELERAAEEKRSLFLKPTAKEEVRHPLQAPFNTAPATKESRRGRQYAEIVESRDAGSRQRSSQQSIAPAPPGEPAINFQQELTLGQALLRENSLEDFASMTLIPDRALRLVLTGDLLFPSGKATLSATARDSLQKLRRLLNRPGLQINIEGHTDNVPVRGRFSSNRALSLARANAVADFLVGDMQVNPAQVVVSGFSSWRPIADNSTAEGRASNRRVEVILSRPPAEAVRGR